MKTHSLKLDESVFEETEKLLEKMDKTRNRCINGALEYYNSIQKRKLLAETLASESAVVREESIEPFGKLKIITSEFRVF